MRSRRLPLLVIVACLLAPAAAEARHTQAHRDAARRAAILRSPNLWATVNVCDSERHPDEIGVRGRMPAWGSRVEARMRIRLEWLDDTRTWRPLGPGADSGLLHAGWPVYGYRERGVLFGFELQPGGSIGLRGIVTFEWRRGTRVLLRVRRYTRAGHPGTVGADPRTFSAGSCRLRGEQPPPTG